jgi:hypothetical protein
MMTSIEMHEAVSQNTPFERVPLDALCDDVGHDAAVDVG